MIEYLYNGMRVHAGNDLSICAIVTDDKDVPIKESISLTLHDKDKETMLYKVDGTYENGEWTFIIPAAITKGLNGRYWYCIQYDGNALCFKEPVYLV